MSDETATGTCQLDVTYQTGVLDHFVEVTDYVNDGESLTFKGKLRKDDGTTGEMAEWFIPIAGNVRSVAKRTDPDSDSIG